MAVGIYGMAVVLTGLLLWWAYHWRIRIDSEGVHCRTLLLWKHRPWTLFEEGQLRRGNGYYSFKFPEWRRNTIDFALADKHSAHRALDLCYAHWVRPSPLPLPERVEFKTRRHSFLGKTTKVKLAHLGVWVDLLHGAATYAWSDVSDVVIVKPSREHDNCTMVSFKVAETRLVADFTQFEPTSLSASETRHIAGFFESYVPASRITVCTDDPPETIRELDERVHLLKFRLHGKGFWSVFGAGMTVFMNLLNMRFEKVEENFVNALTLIASAGAATHVIYAQIKCRSRIRELESLRGQLQENSQTSPISPK